MATPASSTDSRRLINAYLRPALREALRVLYQIRHGLRVSHLHEWGDSCVIDHSKGFAASSISRALKRSVQEAGRLGRLILLTRQPAPFSFSCEAKWPAYLIGVVLQHFLTRPPNSARMKDRT